jgi:hypothetical protein
MRFLKALCLVAIAAFVAMSLIGAGTASAVTMCAENNSPCPESKRYPSETVFNGTLKSGTEIIFSNPISNVACLKSTFGWEITEQSGNPLPGKFTALTFGTPECEGCKKVVAALLPKTKLAASGGKWILKLENNGEGAPRMKFSECPFGVECTYSLEGSELEVVGGTPAKVIGEKLLSGLIAGNKMFCGTYVEWSATYNLNEAIEPGQEGLSNPPVWVTALP